MTAGDGREALGVRILLDVADHLERLNMERNAADIREAVAALSAPPEPEPPSSTHPECDHMRGYCSEPLSAPPEPPEQATGAANNPAHLSQRALVQALTSEGTGGHGGDIPERQRPQGDSEQQDGSGQECCEPSVSSVRPEVGSGVPFGRPDVRDDLPLVRAREDDAPLVPPAAPASPPATEDSETLLETGRRLASKRDNLIAQGANPADLEVPLAPTLAHELDRATALSDELREVANTQERMRMRIEGERDAALVRAEAAEGEAARLRVVVDTYRAALADAQRVIAAVEALCENAEHTRGHLEACDLRAALSPPAEASGGETPPAQCGARIEVAPRVHFLCALPVLHDGMHADRAPAPDVSVTGEQA